MERIALWGFLVAAVAISLRAVASAQNDEWPLSLGQALIAAALAIIALLFDRYPEWWK